MIVKSLPENVQIQIPVYLLPLTHSTPPMGAGGGGNSGNRKGEGNRHKSELIWKEKDEARYSAIDRATTCFAVNVYGSVAGMKSCCIRIWTIRGEMSSPNARGV